MRELVNCEEIVAEFDKKVLFVYKSLGLIYPMLLIGGEVKGVMLWEAYSLLLWQEMQL